MRPAIFLDKDHTLIPDLPYNVDPEKISLTPGVDRALPMLQQAGYAIVVVSNQSGVAKGFFPLSALQRVEEKLRHLLAQSGVRLDGFYCCPHHPEGTIAQYAFPCTCRKPQPGLLRKAAQELGLDMAHSWMIGDIWSDIEAGRAAGCKTILFTYHTDAAHELKTARPDYVATDFAQVAHIVLTQQVLDKQKLE
jgi:D-glycero-D-manno-heptose 1,7-bisphosphate phosphatase